MRFIACCAMLLPACLFPSLGGLSTSDAGASDTGPSDASADVPPEAAARCNPTKPFSTPVPLPGPFDTSVNEFTPRLSADELTVYFSLYIGTVGSVDNYDLYSATRASVGAPFGNPTAITELNSGQGEYDPFILGDNLTLYFASDRPDGTQQRMYVAVRPTPTSPFGAPVVVTTLDVATSVGQIFFLPDDTSVYFANTNMGGIYTATGQDTTFTLPTLVAGLPQSGTQFPSLTGDGLTIILAATGQNDDAFIATRQAVQQPFGTLQPITELNTTFDDDPTWLSPDGCVVLLVSNRLGSTYEMFVAERSL